MDCAEIGYGAGGRGDSQVVALQHWMDGGGGRGRERERKGEHT